MFGKISAMVYVTWMQIFLGHIHVISCDIISVFVYHDSGFLFLWIFFMKTYNLVIQLRVVDVPTEDDSGHILGHPVRQAHRPHRTKG